MQFPYLVSDNYLIMATYQPYVNKRVACEAMNPFEMMSIVRGVRNNKNCV